MINDTKQAPCKIIKLSPDPEEYFQKAIDSLEDGFYWDAITYCRHAIRLEPDCVEYALLLSEIFMGMELYEHSLNNCLRVLSYNETIADCYFEAANSLIALDQPHSALLFLSAGINFASQSSDKPSVDRSEICDLIERSHNHMKLTLVDNDSENSAMYLWATVLYSKESYGMAYSILSNIPATSKFSVRADVLASSCLIKLGRIQEADSVAQSVLERDPDNMDAYTNLMVAAAAKKERERAEEIASIVAKMDLPADHQSLYRHGTALLALGMHRLGLETMERYIEVEPYSRDALVLTGIAYYNTGNTLQAKQLMMRQIKINELDLCARYYNKLFHQKPRPKKPIAYTMELPESVKLDYYNSLERAVDLTESEFDNWIENSDNCAILNWFYYNAFDDARWENLAHMILDKKCVYAEDLLRENLASVFTTNEAKAMLLKVLLYYAPTPPIPVMDGYTLKMIDPKLPRSINKAAAWIRDAYLRSFVTLCFVTESFEKTLVKKFNSIQASIEQLEKKRNDERNLAAALVFVAASKTDNLDVGKVAEFCGASKKGTMRFLNIFKDTK